MMEEQESVYHVKLEAFTGPLDLLLHLIRKHEINIYDIPIALITKQYLEYLELMKHCNLSVAGEFLVMAATLIHIKARMLLPQDETETEDEEPGEDPRSELVRRLMEYQQYKNLARTLEVHEENWSKTYSREVALPEEDDGGREYCLEDVTLFDLLDALQDVLRRTEAQAVLDITPDTITVQDRINAIIERLEREPSVTFAMLFEDVTTRLLVIVTFLALLELARIRLVRIHQGEIFGPIHITRTFLTERSAEECLRNGRGD
ncbi:MAG: segregation/condensation protein A [Nitrospirae bacterium]|nr:MAG: segregation/condensation protein A [Nitrospirota bacterium]